MTEHKRGTPKKIVRYEDFLGSLVLGNISLVECSLSIDLEAYISTEEMTLLAELACKLADHTDEWFNALASLEMNLTGDANRDVGKIHATYMLHFHTKTRGKGMIDRFIKSDVRLMVWPYFRELVNSMSARMSIPPITLPVSGHSDSIKATQKRKR